MASTPAPSSCRRATPPNSRSGFEAYLEQVDAGADGDHWAGPPEMVDSIAEILATRPAHTVLDLGAGLGGPARRLSARVGCRVVALEPLLGVARAGRARTKVRSGAPRFVAGSGTALPFADGLFDQVWCLGVVAHVAEVEALCRETARVLRAGGSFCVTEAFWDGARRPRFAATAPWPWFPLTRDGLTGALTRSGLAAVRWLPWPGGRFFSPDEIAEPNLRADLRDGRLVSAMVVAQKLRPPEHG